MVRILVVEDNTDKLRRICNVLAAVAGVSLRNVENCVDAGEAKRRLRNKKYDLLVLDIAIPSQPEEEVAMDGGIDLLEEISELQGYIVPDHILGLTGYDSLYLVAQDRFRQKDWSVVKYDVNSEEWQAHLRRKAEHIVTAKVGRDCEAQDYETDLAIVCALDDPELANIRRLTWGWERVSLANDHVIYYKGKYRRRGEERIVHAAAAPRMGLTATAILATKMIQSFRPRFVCMSGIAAGIRDRVNLGDVVVVDAAFDYGSGKFDRSGGRSRFLLDPHYINLAPEIRAKARVLSEDEEWLASVRKNWPAEKPDEQLRIHLGPLASGAAVLSDSKITQRVVAQNRKLLGVDMEAYGLFAASAEATDPRPSAFVIKGVCDFADEEKDDSMQRYASYTSASVLARFAEEWL